MPPSDELYKRGPREIIEYAIVHLHRGKEFDLYIGFLLLDIGVEATLKKYLLAPDYVAQKTKALKSQERKSLVEEGKFHEIVAAAQKSYPIVTTFEWARLIDFHTLRNQLYHQGSGMTLRRGDAFDYARLATVLLKVVLDIDITDSVDSPMRAKQEQEALKRRLDAQSQRVRNLWIEIEEQVGLIIDEVAPDILRPRFRNMFQREYIEIGSQILRDGSREDLIIFLQDIREILLQNVEHFDLEQERNNLDLFYDKFFGLPYLLRDESLQRMSISQASKSELQFLLDLILDTQKIKIGFLVLVFSQSFVGNLRKTFEDVKMYPSIFLGPPEEELPWKEKVERAINKGGEIVSELQEYLLALRDYTKA